MLKSIVALAIVLGCCLLAQSAPTTGVEEKCKVLADQEIMEQKTESERAALANGCVEALLAANPTWNTILAENGADNYATSIIALFNSDATPSDVNEHSKTDMDKARHFSWASEYADMILPGMPEGFEEFCAVYEARVEPYKEYLLDCMYALGNKELINETLAKNDILNKVLVLHEACTLFPRM